MWGAIHLDPLQVSLKYRYPKEDTEYRETRRGLGGRPTFLRLQYQKRQGIVLYSLLIEKSRIHSKNYGSKMQLYVEWFCHEKEKSFSISIFVSKKLCRKNIYLRISVFFLLQPAMKKSIIWRKLDEIVLQT